MCDIGKRERFSFVKAAGISVGQSDSNLNTVLLLEVTVSKVTEDFFQEK